MVSSRRSPVPSWGSSAAASPVACLLAAIALLGLAGCSAHYAPASAMPQPRGGEAGYAAEIQVEESVPAEVRAVAPAAMSAPRAEAMRTTQSVSKNESVALSTSRRKASFASDDVGGGKPAAPPPTPNAPSAPSSSSTPAAQAEKANPARQEARSRDLIIYTAKVNMAVLHVPQSLGEVERIGREVGGYLAQKHDREITIRVPRDRFDATLAAIDKVGDVLHRDVQAQDVTDEHVDLEIRIRTARAVQKRLADLLTHATVKEAIEIEKEMQRVTQELEVLEGKLKLLADRVAYSTVTVSFTPRGSTVQASRVTLPFPWLASLGLPSLLSLSEVR